MRRVYKAGDGKSGPIVEGGRRGASRRRRRARTRPANITRLASFVYPRVSNALRNCRARVARVHAKEIARLLNRSLPGKTSQEGIS